MLPSQSISVGEEEAVPSQHTSLWDCLSVPTQKIALLFWAWLGMCFPSPTLIASLQFRMSLLHWIHLRHTPLQHFHDCCCFSSLHRTHCPQHTTDGLAGKVVLHFCLEQSGGMGLIVINWGPLLWKLRDRMLLSLVRWRVKWWGFPLAHWCAFLSSSATLTSVTLSMVGGGGEEFTFWKLVMKQHHLCTFV